MAANAGAGNLVSTKPHDTAYNIFAGYMLNDYMGFEGGYFNLGKFGINTAAGAGTSKVDGFNLDFLALYPLTEKFSLMARLGGNYANTKDSFPGATVPNASKSEGLNLHTGLGAQYAISSSVDVRAEWQRYLINDGFNTRSPINTYTVSLVFPFGSAPAPAAPAAAPAPAPAPVAQAQPAAPEKLTLSAGSLFDFDKAVVKPAGKKSLDKLAHDLATVNYDAVSVTGYTDRIGSDAYNMKLSDRRAASVKKYLVDAHGIPSTKIYTTGKGKADPVTKPGECKGKKVTKALIKCLQPDRRVVVEVSGTKK
jgi:OOP family OmpA-OmpF porin